jgi:hypothetical protein
VLEGLIWQQEQLFQILQQHDRRAEQSTGILLGEATPCCLQSANETLHTITHPVAQSSGLLSAQVLAPALSSACAGNTGQAPAAGNSSSCVLGLLASASPQELQEAGSLTVADLQDWHVRLFEHISPLLELAKREEQLPSDQQRSEPYNAAAAEIAATATWAGQPGAGDCDIQQTQQTSSSSSQHSGEPMSSAGAPAPAEEQQVMSNSTAAGLAGEGHPPDAAGTAASCLAVHQEAKQQLEHCVDAAVRVVALLMLHSPLTSNEVAASNLVTKTQAAAPPQHWLMVSSINLQPAVGSLEYRMSIRTRCIHGCASVGL